MKIKSVSVEVDVNADNQTIETARTQVADTVMPKDVENLPLNGRNFLDLALLVPAHRMGTSRVSTIAEEDAKRVPEDEFLKRRGSC